MARQLAAIVAALGALACVGTLVVRQAGSSTALQALWYKTKGLTWQEKQAIKKSKALARNVRLEEERNPSLVRRFMNAYHAAGTALEEEYDYQFKPWAYAHGLKGSETSQLKVIMTECVKCVSECPACKYHMMTRRALPSYCSLAPSAVPCSYFVVCGAYFLTTTWQT